MKSRKCLDCGINITKKNIRCRLCNNKSRRKLKYTEVCASCGQPKKDKLSIWCSKCAPKLRRKRQSTKILVKDHNTYIKFKTTKYCIDCGVEITQSKSGYCRKCSNKHAFTDERRKKMSSRVSGKGNPLYGKRGKLSPVFGQKPKNGKRIWYKNIAMRSSWETAYAIWLDSKNIKWKYEPTTFNCGDCNYTPDFFLVDLNKYIEVKGWFREKAKKTIVKFRNCYPNIKLDVLQKQELKELGVFNAKIMGEVGTLPCKKNKRNI